MHSYRSTPSPCQQCGRAFFARTDGRGLYCSQACSKQATREAATPRLPINCAVCGTVRMVKPSVLSDGKGTYCSLACRAIGIRTHGETRGGTPSVEFNAWTSMKTRCLNPAAPNYPNYGGRGISICDRWIDSFENFLTDMGRRPGSGYSLDRIDVNGNYSPDNVRWSTSKEQGNNRRTNRPITFNDETHTASEWARRMGLGQTTLLVRLNNGWSIERALTTPSRSKR